MLPATADGDRNGWEEAGMKSIAASILVMGLAFVLATGCGGPTGKSDGSATRSGGDKGEKAYSPDIDPANFVDRVDNKYFPLEPGTTFVYEGKDEEGFERIEVSVTNDSKQIMGVECVVVRDRDWIDGELVEDTFDWHAQDKEGNVWYFGENSREIENGKVVSTEGSWEAGVDGAKPGILIQGGPKVGETYYQEYYAGEAEDKGKVLSLNESATVPYGSFDNLLMTRDWNPLEPAAGVAHKYYAPNIGKIQEVYVEGPPEKVELIDIKTK
jgi:hypothetical protein